MKISIIFTIVTISLSSPVFSNGHGGEHSSAHASSHVSESHVTSHPESEPVKPVFVFHGSVVCEKDKDNKCK